MNPAEAMADVQSIPAGAEHGAAERHLRGRGWAPCGRGEFAIALRSPSGHLVARISPFDPTAPFTAELYRSGAATGWFPQLAAERELAGGANLLLMEFLHPVDTAIGASVHQRLRDTDPAIADAAELLVTVHRRALQHVAWCGPIDDNPRNIRAAADGALRITDPYAGPTLYDAVLTDPLSVARAIPPDRRRHMFAIPLEESGPWDEALVRRMKERLARADEALDR